MEDIPFDQVRYNATLNHIAKVFVSDRCRFQVHHFGEGECREAGFEGEHDRIVLSIRDRIGQPIDSAEFLFNKMHKVLGSDVTLHHGVNPKGQPFVSISDPGGVGFTNDQLFNFLMRAQRDAGLGMGC